MAISSVSPVSQYITAMKDEDTAAANYAKTDATTKLEISKFEESASTITSASDLLNNYTALQVVLGAYNLSSISKQTALIKDLLTQDPTSSKSLAKSSGNATWLAFADAFSTWGKNGGSSTDAVFTSDKIDSIVSSFQLNQYEGNDDNSDSGVGNALYFTRSIGSKTSLAEIMSDSKLLKVVVTVSGYDPDQFGALDYDQQVRMLSKTFDINDFSSDKKIQQYAERYLAMLQINPQTTDKPATMMDLFGGDGDSNSILALFDSSSSSTSGSLYSGLF
ncbi:DUF1217 domain-containing protein [Acetobacter vaccinii]|uniref:DUF1217 domain-containing protein n=1 Tax=Acetobacter vaccinii TaxID=2592655 RepID=A0A5C1YLN5_9PROT|nr:DUF1217 domain-containing protein [Acetobacter vaccinii]QEO16903.1 DUF1217 domain-containing protein [Acetobacter vaccinii]